MRVCRWLSAFGIMLALAAPAAAQSQIATAVIEGVVVDSSGGVLPGVEVEVRNVETNFTRSLTTDAEGRFVALQLPPGRYTATFSLSGFATIVQENVVVTVGQSARLNTEMRPSGVAETITVTTQTPIVDLTRTAASTTLDETTIGTTPILGRKFEDLLTLTPGVSVTQGPDGDEINFAGQRGVFNNISLDGGDYNNGFFGEQVGGQRAAIDITLDAVKEFQVIATGAPAEFGRTAGGVVNVITKSGTNELRGQRVPLPAARGADLEHVRRQTARRTSPRAVRRDARRSAREGQPVLLRRVRRHPREPAACRTCRCRSARPARSRRPTHQRQRSADQLAAPTASVWRCSTSSGRRAARKRACPSTHTVNNNALLGKMDWTLSPRPTTCRSRTTSTTRRTITRPSTCRPTATRRTAPRAPRRSTSSTSTSSRRSRRPVLNEVHFTYFARDRVRDSATPSNIPADTGDRLRHDVPLRQPVLPGAERRRAGEAVPDQGQRLDRRAAATPSRPAASGCTPTTTRCSAASSRAATSSTASPASCATRRRRRRAASARTRSAARTART